MLLAAFARPVCGILRSSRSHPPAETSAHAHRIDGKTILPSGIFQDAPGTVFPELPVSAGPFVNQHALRPVVAGFQAIWVGFGHGFSPEFRGTETGQVTDFLHSEKAVSSACRNAFPTTHKRSAAKFRPGAGYANRHRIGPVRTARPAPRSEHHFPSRTPKFVASDR